MKLVISKPAQNDFNNILSYTFGQWGERQMYKYEELLNDGLKAILQNPFSPLSKKYEHKQLKAHYLRVEKHYIFYVIENELIVILRILHTKMNPSLHL